MQELETKVDDQKLYDAETRRIEQLKLDRKLNGVKQCKFEQGKKNNMLAREYGTDIFDHVEPQGSRICVSQKRFSKKGVQRSWLEGLSDKK